jgi:nitric oxide reductase large subunit
MTHQLIITRKWPLWRVDGAHHHENVIGGGRYFWRYWTALDFARLVASANSKFGSTTEITAGTLRERYEPAGGS